MLPLKDEIKAIIGINVKRAEIENKKKEQINGWWLKMTICLKIKGSSDSFVEAINVAIQNNNILTWAVDVEGDYTSSVLQWQEKAWFRPIEDSFSEFNLSFGIIKAY